MRFERIQVETRDSFRTAQDPSAFVWRGDRHEVTEILDRWYEGYVGPRRVPMRYFRVRTRDGSVHVVRYHELFTAWSILITEQPGKGDAER